MYFQLQLHALRPAPKARGQFWWNASDSLCIVALEVVECRWLAWKTKNKALAEQHYRGAVLAILKPKKKGYDKALAKRFKMEFKMPECINAAIEGIKYDPPMNAAVTRFCCDR